MHVEPRNTLDLEVTATTDGISEARDRFHDFLTRLNLPEISVFDLATAFYEVAANIRAHGGLTENACLAVRATVTECDVWVRFVDPGRLFDPTHRIPVFDPQVAIRRRQTNRFGLAMITRLVDEMSYERLDERLNVLTLRRRLGPNGGH